MTNENKHTKYFSILNRYTFILAMAWTITVVISFLWNYINNKNKAELSAIISARSQFTKDLIYRRWNAEHGGVYAPVSENNKPNQYLTQVREREIVTPSGHRLTLINPAYMTRQVHELGLKAEGVMGHITSLNPIRPANAPDPWERKALLAFEKNQHEYSSVEMINNSVYLRLMRPLKTEKGCLKCHAQQGYREGDIRGGISVSTPMAPYMGITREQILAQFFVHLLFLVLGFAGIAVGTQKVRKHIAKRIQSEKELEKAFLEKKHLLQELQHRAKNSFTMISSLVDLAASTSKFTEVKTAFNEIGSRIMAISELYELLFSTDSVYDVQLDEYICRITNSLNNLSLKINLETRCDAIILPVKICIPIGIIVTELITNSIKHAFPENRSGTITVSLKKTNIGAIIEIMDNGTGLPEGFDISAAMSLGLNLIQILVEQIDGSFKIESSDGTRGILEFPVTKNTSPGEEISK